MKIVCHGSQELISAIRKWHQNKVGQLNLIVEHSDADLDFGNGTVIKAGSDAAKGFRVCAMVVLELLSTLPEFESIEFRDDEGCDDE
ncbi:hypothetical protein ACFDWR_004521 [Salmonella enterica]|uniref:Uncharacterized protein n=1 Tax=Salmonella enterica TaxID=28901 RepID=A0A5V2QT96_SALER|nr:hypothetical protein [Salmonella enterica subsp. enterica serovar Oranienburg]EAM4817597.1 hypothetical protein [Salmonella enterica]EBF2453196.1 hypothetical protein [Salmonella enterica subsp. enterica serovar Poona]EBS6471491.1 hypothetical protein [Salmonella enterica subsp. enterica serovar Panama]EBV5807918.1 hypothetical protein [Salmonella enterica subsp. enterica serovar Abaetetuba]ECI0430024.1 hypothetical protein [Salmonella enterica subsp. enterica serovar Soumbedioune]ECY37980